MEEFKSPDGFNIPADLEYYFRDHDLDWFLRDGNENIACLRSSGFGFVPAIVKFNWGGLKPIFAKTGNLANTSTINFVVDPSQFKFRTEKAKEKYFEPSLSMSRKGVFVYEIANMSKAVGYDRGYELLSFPDNPTQIDKLPLSVVEKNMIPKLPKILFKDTAVLTLEILSEANRLKTQ